MTIEEAKNKKDLLKSPCDLCRKKNKRACMCMTWRKWFGEAWEAVIEPLRRY